MHPGPMNRGVEILVDPSELPGAVITQQVANGVAVRMAVLFELLGCGRVAVSAADQWRPRHRPDGGAARRRARSTDDRIAEVGDGLDADETLDATGCVVAPGFVDLHAHLREPGREDAETIETGSRAAALGGYTAVVAMPNTDPASGLPRRGRARARSGRGGRPVRGASRRLHHDGPGGGGAGPVRRARRRRRATVHRRRQRRAGPAADAPGDGVLARPRRRPRPALRGRPAHRRGGDARGALLQRARPARLAGRRRGADGPPRHRAGPPHRCADPPAAPVDRRAASSSCEPPRPTAWR